jgi:putative SOS response-associated peptidase YedK
MCGRFAQIETITDLIKAYFIDDVLTEITPSYNIAPGSKILSIIRKDGKRLLVDFQWGLIPHWAKEAAIGHKTINARAESISEKPSFRNAFKARRCLIPANGFYEWKQEGRIKVPHYIRLESCRSFAFAGIHESWMSPGGKEVNTCAIITTGPNEVMGQIHNRMPVILGDNYHGPWLDPDLRPEDALALLKPYPGNDMEAYPVTTLVNSPKNDTPDCIRPA